jgi:hypothetical protein
MIAQVINVPNRFPNSVINVANALPSVGRIVKVHPSEPHIKRRYPGFDYFAILDPNTQSGVWLRRDDIVPYVKGGGK